MEKDGLERLRESQARWEGTTLKNRLANYPEWREGFFTMSGIPVKRLYTPEEVEDLGYLRDLGFPGEETGLSVAFDYPTLYGYDTDDPEAEGEFGKCGVAISSLADMEILFEGIPLHEVTTSMTINGPAAVVWAMYMAAAEKQGVPQGKLGGTIQNDILKEYIAQKSFIFPPEPSMRLIVDTFEYGSKYVRPPSLLLLQRP